MVKITVKSKVNQKSTRTSKNGTAPSEGSVEGDEFHIQKQILPIVSAVNSAISGSKDWFLELPQIKFLLQIPILKDLLLSAVDISSTVAQVGKEFCETVYGVNLARNSRVYQQNLAGRGLNLLANIRPSSGDKSLYEGAVLAHNESLNLPELSKKIGEVEGGLSGDGKSPIEIMNQWRIEAITKATDLMAQLTAKVKELKGNAKRGARVQLKRASDALDAMLKRKLPQIFASSNSDYNIKSSLNWQINSTSRYDISSINQSQSNIYASAIVPIAVGGAATLTGAGAIIGSIASWFLTNVFLKAVVGFPMAMLDALKHTVTSIVLKVLGSSGANAYRFLAASVIKAGKNYMPVIFAQTGMLSAAWAFLMPYALPIMLTAIIIITSMRNRNKVLLGQNLYVYGKTSETMFSLGTAHLYNTDRKEMRTTLQEMAKSLKNKSGGDFEKFYGVAADDDDVPVMVFDFKENVNNPILTVGDEAIRALLGGDFATILETYTLF